jgi:hypothetical protein
MLCVYNGIDLSADWLTRSVSHEPEWDPMKCDQLYTKMTIGGTSIIAANLIPAATGEEPGDIVERIRHYLTAPRRPFLFNPGNAGVQINLPGGLDDANGPKPKVFAINSVTPGSFVVSWEIEVCLVDCGEAPPPYLSCRWSEVQSYDRLMRATRSIDGTLILSSRAPVAGDDFRLMVTPALAMGFRRELSEYVSVGDGVTWKFRFEDRQLCHQPPYPALEMRGHQIESIPMKGGVRRGELVLSLYGPPGAQARDLLTVGCRLALARIHASNPMTFKSSGKVMMGGAIRESLDDDKIGIDLRFEWNMRAPRGRITSRGGLLSDIATGVIAPGYLIGRAISSALTPEGLDPAGVPTYAEWLGRPLEGTTAAWPTTPPTRGLTAGMRMAAALLRDPCGAAVELRASKGGTEMKGVTSDGASVLVSEAAASAADLVKQVDDFATLYVDEDLPGTWDHYHVATVYERDPGVIVVSATAPGTKPAKVRVSGETLKMRAEWSLTRIGGKPELPFRKIGDSPDWAIVKPGSLTSYENLDVASDGVSVRYSASGMIHLASLDPESVQESWPIPPFLNAAMLQQAAKVEIQQPTGPVVGP